MEIKNKVVAARISEEQKVQLELAARDMNMTSSRLLREIIRVYVANEDYFKDIFFENLNQEER